MSVLYNLGIRGYYFIILLASFFNEKAKEWIIGRKNVFKSVPDIKGRTVYWFHCASLGEFDQALPVMNAFKEKNPNIFILVTFFSPSGYMNYQKRKHQVDFACYLPIDTRKNARKFIKNFHPEKVFIVKYEFWANFIFELKNNKIPTYSISTILRPNQIYFKWYGTFFREILRSIDYFFVQTEETCTLLKRIGINSFMLSGDTRYDRVIENKNQLQKNELIAQFVGDNKAFIIGSSWPNDEEILLPFVNNISKSKKIIIAPHDIQLKHIEAIISKLKVNFVLYSDLEKGGKKSDVNVLILNTIGHLANAYNYGDIAYVGGGFSGNLHNILEPAVFGLPIIFGPKHSKFPEASIFINKKVGFEIQDLNELEIIYQKINNDLLSLKKNTEKIVIENTGASEKIISEIMISSNSI